MKALKLFIAVPLVILAFMIGVATADYETRGAETNFGGSVGALDSIDGAILSAGMHAFVIDESTGIRYDYVLKVGASPAVESVPVVIVPDSNAGNKYWQLIKYWVYGLNMGSVAITELETDGAMDGGNGSLSTAGGIVTYVASRFSSQYREVFIPAGAFVPLTTGGASTGTFETTTNDLNFDYMDFDTTAEEGAQVNFVLAGYRSGDIKARAMWSPAGDTGDVADTVEWEVHIVFLADASTIDTAPGSAVISDAVQTGENATMHITAATPAITPGGTANGSSVVCVKVTRNVSGTDDHAADARLFGVFLQYPFDGMAGISAW